MLPWDTDIDVQTLPSQLPRLYSLNSTIFENRYLLDVNPNSKFKNTQENNKIDARFIDTQTGRFIDVTVIGDRTTGRKGREPVYFSCKSPHKYRYEWIFPLIEDEIEGSVVLVPREPQTLLKLEYGESSIWRGEYSGWRFNDVTFLWEEAARTRQQVRIKDPRRISVENWGDKWHRND